MAQLLFTFLLILISMKKQKELGKKPLDVDQFDKGLDSLFKKPQEKKTRPK